MNVSMRVYDKLKDWEGLRTGAYQDSGGVWTIGYGHTKGVRPHDVCTHVQADAWLEDDVDFAATCVDMMTKKPLTQGQFDALVSLCFNVGPAKLKRSTLVFKVNAGDLPGAAAEFPKWCHAGTQILPGLVKRRKQEQEWFCEAS